MEYRKTGRGGAGNYYSQQDLEKVAKEAAKGKVDVHRLLCNTDADPWSRILKLKKAHVPFIRMPPDANPLSLMLAVEAWEISQTKTL